MDFKKLSSFILLAGLTVFLYGAIVTAANRPITKTPNTGNVIKDINLSITNLAGNFSRQTKRKHAEKFLLIGGVILFAGVAVRMSSKKF